MISAPYDYKPTARQTVGHNTMSDEILYGGAAGGGKSRWARAECLRMCLFVPGSRVVLFRRTFPELERAVIDPLRMEMPPGVARYYVGTHTWRFGNGSILELAYMEGEADVHRYQGAEYSLIVFEELTQFSESQYRYLLGRLRVAGRQKTRMAELGWRPRIISTSNPGGMGHLWVKARFIDAGIRSTIWQPAASDDDPDPGTRCYVPAKVSDNPHVDAGYIRQLNRQEPILRRALRDGDWTVLEGVRFTEFRYDLHVIKATDIPIDYANLPLGIGVDWGIRDPFAALWGAVLPGRRIVIYRGLHRTNLTSTAQAALILASEAPGERTPWKPIPIALDRSCWNRQSESPLSPVADREIPPMGSIAHFYRQAFGGAVRKAQNARISGWALIDELMQVRDDGLPGLLISDTCLDLIRTLPSVQRHHLRPEDVEHHDSHDVDALRYLCQLLAPTDARTGMQPAEPPLPQSISAGLASARF